MGIIHNQLCFTLSIGAPVGGAWSRFAGAWRLDGSVAITAILVCVLGFMVLYPIGTVVNMSFKPDGLDSIWSLDAWGRAWNEPGLVVSDADRIDCFPPTSGG